jgi:uncharacterized protein YehS (DUF1456 family)
MLNNDVLRSIRYMLDLTEPDLVQITKLGGFQVSLSDFGNFLRNDDEPEYLKCADHILAHFLDGLVIYRRGQEDAHPPMPLELPMTNNLVLKKLRVAFVLREDDILGIFNDVGFRIGRAELSAFFRRKEHQNYRECGDQVLRNFLKGLTQRARDVNK